MSTVSDSLGKNETRRDESNRQGEIMKMGRQTKTPAGFYPALAAATGMTQEPMPAC